MILRHAYKPLTYLISVSFIVGLYAYFQRQEGGVIRQNDEEIFKRVEGDQ